MGGGNLRCALQNNLYFKSKSKKVYFVFCLSFDLRVRARAVFYPHREPLLSKWVVG